MTYWLLMVSIALLIAAAPVYTSLSRGSLRWLALLVLLALAVLFAAVALAFVDHFLGPEAWYDRSPTREVLLFALMGLGMIARMLSLAIEDRRTARSKNPGAPAPALVLDHWDLVYPFLSSAICFGALIDVSGGRGFDLVLALFAFQNGFFWQTVLAGAKP